MKARLLFIFFFGSLVAGASDNYVNKMTTNIALVYKAQTSEELLQAVNLFERIGKSEKNKWEPFYYAAFGEIMLSNREKDNLKKDTHLDQAKVFLDLASAISQNNSEIVTLEGFIHMMRVAIDPATRGQQYSALSMQAFGKALALDPNNPRALTLMAQMQYGTAQFFNSSTDETCATIAKAVVNFDKEKQDNELAPRWGKTLAENLKNNCK